MSLHTLAATLSRAEEGGYAVGAFNVSDLNQAVAVLDAARAERSPVIVQAIAGFHPYADEGWWWDRLRELIISYHEVEVTLHLDHGRTFDDCARAIEHGFTSVMIDASRDVVTDEPASYEANVELTRSVVELAHPRGVSVEGELGTIGGAEGGVSGVVEDIVLADPALAADFVERTGVDALAVAVGTSHGSVKFTTDEGGQTLRIDLIREIKERLPSTFLVLHGSSSIPPEAVATINRFGGILPESYGIATTQKQEGIGSGIRKVNQGTDSHLTWTAALREFLAARPSEVEPSAVIGVTMAAMRDIVAQRMREFGSAGRAA
ncbi:ketose-bisphosphate aldolase [Pseudolysinimonas yzui]|uniref:Fructose-1,6-bisphosphate aldolase n=1 Tax=Pseudolysinimonas yzui TaxID=2708254 RepID=A0A8J3GRW7_9MICO|nr:ketose-bisphosphate aldolase [Pseudolysinimonas yzui]GHF22943.1 fructose-1,6-bisphosphate aldolase [Pseudolysinimonas yzui]